MPMFSFRPIRAILLPAVALCSLALAQGPITDGSDTLYLATKVGSMKIVGSDLVPPTGHLEMSFTGTILLSGLNGKLDITGKVKKEYEDLKFSKTAYFGTGKIVIDGKFSSLQWFGRDMNAVFKGTAVFRIFGEFDKDLNTGTCYFGSAPKDKINWDIGGRSIVVPVPPSQRRVIPKVHTGGG